MTIGRKIPVITTKQVGLSVVGGFAVLVLSLVATGITSHQFLAEGPDTRLAELIAHTWDWAFHLQPHVRPLLAADPTRFIAFLFVWGLPLALDSIVVFLLLRAIIRRRRADQPPQTRIGSSAPDHG